MFSTLKGEGNNHRMQKEKGIWMGEERGKRRKRNRGREREGKFMVGKFGGLKMFGTGSVTIRTCGLIGAGMPLL